MCVTLERGEKRLDARQCPDHAKLKLVNTRRRPRFEPKFFRFKNKRNMIFSIK